MEKIRIGVFGTFRGLTFIKCFKMIEGCEVVAICDSNPEKLNNAKAELPSTVKIAENFDELLECGIDAVVLCNFFNEHARYAVKALNKNISVFSETTPAVTLAECVELVEAEEASEGIYCLAENYPFFRTNMEIRRVYESGILGKVVFAEGEYVHPMSPKDRIRFRPTGNHWRDHLPKTYYSTHALAPLMLDTGLMPKRVIGKMAARVIDGEKADSDGLMLVEMDNGAVFRIAGSCPVGTHGNWYRLDCEKGGIESVRGGNDEKVRLSIHPWHMDDSVRSYATECEYYPELTEMGLKAMGSGHAGGDFWICWHFIQAMLGKEKPVFPAKVAAAISSVAILGWRSILEDSRQMDIPDYSKKEERDRVRNDRRNPFLPEDDPDSIPYKLFYPGH